MLRILALVLVSWAGFGCTDDTEPQPPGEFVSLIDHHAWEVLPETDDPLASHRPATIECGIAGWYVEDQVGEPKLEIDTNYCNYAALRQPTLVAIEAGAHIRLNFYHFNLVAPEPAQAHVAILVEDTLLWEQVIEIPGDGTAAQARVWQDEVFVSPLTAPAGAELILHVHNHGQNTYTLVSLEAETWHD